MRLLSANHIAQLVSMPEAIAAVREGFAQLATGRARAPVRLVVALPRHDATVLAMPGYIAKPETFAIKTVSINPENAHRGLPRVQATILALDPADGRPLGLLDGTSVTALRTGAASGVATQLLARKKVTVGLVVGAGPQARTQLLAIDEVRRFDEIRVLARTKRSADKLVRSLRGKTRASLAIAETARTARDADVICTATNSTSPVLMGDDIRPGCHVNGVGSFRPDMQELDQRFIQRCDKIVVDERQAAWAEAGELIAARADGILEDADIYAEIGELCAGTKPGRQHDDEITFFKSVGNAVQDAAVAAVALRAANARKVGTEVPF